MQAADQPSLALDVGSRDGGSSLPNRPHDPLHIRAYVIAKMAHKETEDSFPIGRGAVLYSAINARVFAIAAVAHIASGRPRRESTPLVATPEWSRQRVKYPWS